MTEHICDCIISSVDLDIEEFVPIEYAVDGQDVWIMHGRADGFRHYNMLQCKVACASGSLVRVVNTAHRIDRWKGIESLYVPCVKVFVSNIMES